MSSDTANSGKAFKAGIWYTVSNFVTKGAVFLTTPLFTRLMSKQDIGAYSNITSWLAVLVILASFEFATSLMVARFDFKDKLDEYIGSTLAYGTCITLIFYGVAMTNIDWFATFFSMPKYAIHLIFLYICFYPAVLMYQYDCRFKYNYKGVILSSLGSLFVSTGAALLCTVGFNDKLLGRTVGYFTANIAVYLSFYVYLILKGKKISARYLKYAVRLSFPMIWHALSGQVLNAGDRIIITKYLGEEANAMYSIAYTCGMVVYVLWNSMNSAWAPWATERMDQNEITLMKRATKPYMVFFGGVAVFAMLVAPEFLLIMGGKTYVEAKYVFPPIIAGYICQCVYSLYVNCEFYMKKQSRIAIGTMVSAILNLGLNIIFVPRFGYVAAAYTTWAGFFCLVLFHYLSVKQLGKESWYENKFQWSFIIVGALLVPAMNLLYLNNVIRYMCIVLIFSCSVLAFIKKKDKVRNLIQRIIK